MTQALLSGGALGKVLEIGFGCGYQTAVLAPFAQQIHAIERVEPLVERAKQRLKELQIRNVKLKHGDGMQGWPRQAPFDGIIVAAAPLSLPEALVQQLAPGGRLVVPVGPDGQQQLWRITRRETGLHKEQLGPVAFVPMLAGTA
jgi:protein-L-isoaspartate(D-aspartate) O-methyltransferase